MQARTARQNNLAEAVAALVDDELVPQAMVQSETENRLQDMAMRLQAQGIEFEQYLQFTGQDPQVVMAEMSTQAELTAKVDLALRAIAAQESITATDDELDIELETVAERFDRSVDEVRSELVEAGQLAAVRADLVKTKTMDWLNERISLVDEDGQPVSPDALEMPDDPDPDDPDHENPDHQNDADPSSAAADAEEE